MESSSGTSDAKDVYDSEETSIDRGHDGGIQYHISNFTARNSIRDERSACLAGF